MKMSDLFRAAGEYFGLWLWHMIFGCQPTTCSLNACFLYSRHPLYDATCGPLQLAKFGFLASLFGRPLWEWLSPQIRHFCLDLQFFAERPKLWQLKHCVTKTGNRNSSTLYTMPVTLQTKFWERRASASVGSLNSRLFCFLSVQPWRNRFCSDQGIREILCPLYRSELLLLQEFWLVWKTNLKVFG